MTDKQFLNRFAVTVQEFNRDQENQYFEYYLKCRKNGVMAEPFSRYFTKFDYKHGFVLPGKYPKYSKLKRNLI